MSAFRQAGQRPSRILLAAVAVAGLLGSIGVLGPVNASEQPEPLPSIPETQQGPRLDPGQRSIEGTDSGDMGIMAATGTISGRVMYSPDPWNDAKPLATGRVTAFRLIDDSYYAYEAFADVVAAGYYDLPVVAGTYRLRFTDTKGTYSPQYWEGVRFFALATDVIVEAGGEVALGDVALVAQIFDVGRISGADRFEVGVNVAQTRYPDGYVPAEGVPVVYVANGFNFPDALVAGPAAAREGGLVLLVEPDAIPAVVKAELQRLRPQRIVVAGGPGSVSPAVFQQLAAYAPSPGAVTRQGGADRYEAARNVVADAFGATGAPLAIVATGANFPDALSAGPAAASRDGAVILVDGSAPSLDSSTRQLLQDLGVQRVYIAGGTGSVHPGIETSLQNLLGAQNVTRFAGADRFAVGVMLAQEFFGFSDYAFVATGHKFPDALTGGPLAAAVGAPLYLANPTCVPREVGYDILDLQTQALVLLGGPASLGDEIGVLTVC